MRLLALWIVVSGSLAGLAAAQEEAAREDMPLTGYLIELTEFRLSGGSGPGVSASELIKRFEQLRGDGKLELVEVVRLSALAGHQSTAQFGKRVGIPTSVMSDPRRGRIQQVQMHEIGTLVRVTAASRGDRIVLELTYEASRLEKVPQANDEDEPIPSHNIATIQIATTLALKSGEQQLVGGTSNGSTSLLAVTITER